MSGARLLFGAGGIGTTAKGFTYTWDTPQKITELLTVLRDDYNITQLDSAASYPPGNPWNTETLLGQTPLSKSFQIDTKIIARTEDGKPLSPANLKLSLDKSLGLLGLSKVQICYAHISDKNTPMRDTAAGFDALYREGKFQQLGLCNYTLEELEQYVEICEQEGFVQPSVVQDQYNALSRLPERAFPFFRKHGIVFNAYSPLAGGFLTGKVTRAAEEKGSQEYVPLGERSRWEGESVFAMYPETFGHERVHGAMRKFRGVCREKGVSETEVSLRWLAFHSCLGEEDGIVLGATRVEQLRANVEMVKRGRLSEELVRAVDVLHEEAKVGDMFAAAR